MVTVSGVPVLRGRKLISAMTTFFSQLAKPEVSRTWDLQCGGVPPKNPLSAGKMQIRLEEFYSLALENRPNMLA